MSPSQQASEQARTSLDLLYSISRELIGRNVLQGRWSFQVIEDYDDGYYRCFQEMERTVRQQLTGG